MAEYIERAALLKQICNSCDGWCENTGCDCINCKSEHRCDLVKQIHEAHAADAVEVVHGTWENYPSHIFRRCSVCKVEFDKPKFNVRANYCPNCGARMDGEGKDN